MTVVDLLGVVDLTGVVDLMGVFDPIVVIDLMGIVYLMGVVDLAGVVDLTDVVVREEAERKGREMAMLVAELQRMRAETNREAVGQPLPPPLQTLCPFKIILLQNAAFL